MKKSAILSGCLIAALSGLFVIIVSAGVNSPASDTRKHATDIPRVFSFDPAVPGVEMITSEMPVSELPLLSNEPNVRIVDDHLGGLTISESFRQSAPEVIPDIGKPKDVETKPDFNVSACMTNTGTGDLIMERNEIGRVSDGTGPSVWSAPPESASETGSNVSAEDRSKTAPYNNRISPQSERNRGDITLDDSLMAVNFNDGLVPPSGWSRFVHNMNNPTFTWHAWTGGMAPVGYHASINWASDLTLQDEWLVSPSLDLTTQGDHWFVRFWWATSYYWAVSPYDNYDLELRISTDGGHTWEPNILWTEHNAGAFYDWQWCYTQVNLDAYRTFSNVKLAWRYYGFDGAQAGFDNIEVANCEVSCAESDWAEAVENPADTTFYRNDPDGGLNNGNYGGVNQYGQIGWRETVCGRGFTYLHESNTFRDTDWYLFTLTECSNVILRVKAEFPVQFGIVDTASLSFVNVIYADPCIDTVVRVNGLAAGTYAAWIGPSIFSGIPDMKPYRATLDYSPCSGTGENCASAKAIITLPYTDIDSTTGRANDFTGCGSSSPDMIYVYRPLTSGPRRVSLCGSLYDTKLEIRTIGPCPGQVQYLCNDDVCGLQSEVVAHLNAGETYYIIVDGYGGYYGRYTLSVTDMLCTVAPQTGDIVECTEVPGIANLINGCDGGCNNPSQSRYYQDIHCGETVYGSSFTYRDEGGSLWRDTDWYRFTLTEPDTVKVTIHTDFNAVVFILDTVCANLTTYAAYNSYACDTTLVTTNACLPAGTYILWIGPEWNAELDGIGHYRATLFCPLCPGSSPRPCPQDCTLFGQPPARPFDVWALAHSDANSDYRWTESFSNIGYMITGVHFWGTSSVNGSIFEACTENPMSFNIQFRQDSSGWPGGITRSYNVSLRGLPTGDRYGNAPLYSYTTMFPQPVFMNKGWISIYGTGGASDCWFLWPVAATFVDSAVSWGPGGMQKRFNTLSVCLLGEQVPTPVCDPDYSLLEKPVSSSTAWTGFKSDQGGPFRQEVAARYSNVNEVISRLEFWGANAYPALRPCLQNPKPFTIRFYQDAGGTPGAVSCSTGVYLAAEATGLLYQQHPVLEYRATISACTLSSGWLSVQAADSDTCMFYWITSGIPGAGTSGSVWRTIGAWIPMTTTDFSLCLGGLPTALISGYVRYHISNETINGVEVDVSSGDSVLSGPSGFYHFADLPAEQTYIVKPNRRSETDCEASISFLDASLVAQHAIGQTVIADTLKLRAADVSGDASVTMLDASLIGQFAIGSIVEFPGLAEWVFNPDSMEYNPLGTSRTNQNYSAICMGDVSANWTAAAPPAIVSLSEELNKTLSTDGKLAAKNVGRHDAYAVQFDCVYDPLLIRFVNAKPAAEISGWYVFTRIEEGVVHIGGFGVNPVSAGQTIVETQFESVASGPVSGDIRMDNYRINDDAVLSSSVYSAGHLTPSEYKLDQNYPNPFNATTVIEYALPERCPVQLTVYNTLGEQVAVLADEVQEANFYRITFDGSNLGSGVYFYRLEAGSFRKIQKMVLLK